MATIYAIHVANDHKLSCVILEMERMGAPTIEVVDCGDHYMALEGSHRLAAAATLGITPELVIHKQQDLIDISKYDWFEACNWSATTYRAGEVAGELFSPYQVVPYTF
ncbi:hypothetical protein [Sinorhizobium medicae]|uniref:hypothetical protein n=1 Tax=Sinorhizobium medicae TaxID=110321 RepID=UPI001297A858|nr:hypothetical protein [Sinorhizobium medicae]MQX78114.1 hypothetical protein [Sinorhizobium medicae]